MRQILFCSLTRIRGIRPIAAIEDSSGSYPEIMAGRTEDTACSRRLISPQTSTEIREGILVRSLSNGASEWRYLGGQSNRWVTTGSCIAKANRTLDTGQICNASLRRNHFVGSLDLNDLRDRHRKKDAHQKQTHHQVHEKNKPGLRGALHTAWRELYDEVEKRARRAFCHYVNCV
jgi:hypothetical protein